MTGLLDRFHLTKHNEVVATIIPLADERFNILGIKPYPVEHNATRSKLNAYMNRYELESTEVAAGQMSLW